MLRPRGYIQKIDARKIGLSAMILGAGRENKESGIDYGAGIYLLKKYGEDVQAGEPIMTLYTSSIDKVQPVLDILAEAVTISGSNISIEPVVSTVVR